MATLYDLLKLMIESNASDLHITTGTPPRISVDGKLMPIKEPALTPAETKALCYSILTDTQKHNFEENNELDLSFGWKPITNPLNSATSICMHPACPRGITSSTSIGRTQGTRTAA